MRIALALFVLLQAGNADACRCAERGLAEYFADADAVVIGRLNAAEDSRRDVQLTFELLAPAYKGPSHLGAGDEYTVLTAGNSAACGVGTEPGAVYIVFAWRDPVATNSPSTSEPAAPSAGDVMRVDSCSGTRVHLPADGSDPLGFSDVPPRFVAQQLNGLAGLDVLQAVAANAPQPSSPENERLVGVLDLAALAHGGHVDVFAAPDAASRRLAQVDSYEEIESREYDYELSGAVVYAVLPGWYRLRLADGRYGWAAAGMVGTYFPYPDIVLKRLNYLTASWSGFVWPEAGAGLPLRDLRARSNPRGEFPAEVHEVKTVGGMPFLHVTVWKNDPCGSGEGVPAMSGWVPAFGRDGRPTVWFWSRGC